MLEPLGVAIHAVDLGHVRTGDTVGVLGCGPIGLFCLQVAKRRRRARLVATDLASRPHRLDAAHALGAVGLRRPRRAARPRPSSAAVGGLGLDVAIECAGTQAAVDAALESVAPGRARRARRHPLVRAHLAPRFHARGARASRSLSPGA